MVIILVFFIGTVFGSFINATAHRIVRNMDYITERSCCPLCHHQLSFLDMIPIISYVIRKGECKYCRTKIAKRYLITEVLGGINAITCWNLNSNINIKVLFFIILDLLLFMALIDIEIKEIKDVYQLQLLIVAIVVVLIEKWSFDNCIGMVIISLPLLTLALITKSIGGADVKLFFTLGMLNKGKGIIIVYFLTILFASIFALYRLKKEGNKKEEIALIPFIYLAFLTYKTVETQLLNCLIFWLT